MENNMGLSPIRRNTSSPRQDSESNKYPVSRRWFMLTLLFTVMFAVATMVCLNQRFTLSGGQPSYSVPKEVIMSPHQTRSVLKNIICVGDSITRWHFKWNYPATLEGLLRRPSDVGSRDNGVDLSDGVNVLNFGRAGAAASKRIYSYTATEEYSAALRAMGNIWTNGSDVTERGPEGSANNASDVGKSQSKVGVLILMLGTNDSIDRVWRGTAQYVEDMVEIATSLIKRAFVPQSNNTCQEGAKRRLVVILMTPPPVFKCPVSASLSFPLCLSHPTYKPRMNPNFIKGKYKFFTTKIPLDKCLQIIANEIRDGIREAAKRLSGILLGELSTPRSNMSAEKVCSPSMDIRVTVNVIDLFTLFLNAMIKTATDHGQLPTVERTSANYYDLDADTVQQWLHDGIHPQGKGDDLIANVVYEFIKSSALSG